MASKILVDELAPHAHATDVTLTTGKNITGANTQFKITGGSSGNVLTTDGSGALTWGAIAAGFTDAHVDVSSGSVVYTVPTGVTKLLVFITGAGGGGTGGNNTIGPGGGGGGGGTVMARVTVVATDTITLVIGAGGTGGVQNTVGTVGGDSSFTHSTGTGSFDAITAPGGATGVISGVSTTPVTPTIGTSNAGLAITGGWGLVYGSNSGSSFWGSGGTRGEHAAFAATDALAYGAGGGGGTYSAGLYVGGDGADGACLIMEFK
jgi:hypothetical protein